MSERSPQTVDPGRSELAYLDRPGVGRLLSEARLRFERNGGSRGSVVLGGLQPDEADALNGLLAPAVPFASGGEARVKLERLDRELRSSRIGVSLEQALVHVGGPLTDLPAARVARASERERAWAEVLAHPQAGRPELRRWLEHARRAYGGADPERAALVLRALDVLSELPAPGIELARLAATRAGGDAHALDRDRRLGRLLTAALVGLAGGDPTEAVDAERWRALWADAGVSCDDLSCTALTLGLRPRRWTRTYLAGRMRAAGRQGAPIVLTLRELRRDRPRLAGRVLFVCENPSVVSAAARELGSGCPPLLCTGGWPNTAVAALLEHAVEAGIRIRVSTDRDHAGAAIAERILALPGASGWLAADGSARAEGAVVHEEAMLGELISELRRGEQSVWE